MSMNNLTENRRKRGEITDIDLIPYRDLKEEELFILINNIDPVKRTCAATLLGNFTSDSCTFILCNRLKIEDKLYTKIAICNSLVLLQKLSFNLLLDLLGKIGRNQEKSLPQKGFLKKSYPLPRDIAARTLCRFDPWVLDELYRYICKPKSILALEQAIDVIGHISFTNSISLKTEPLFKLLDRHDSEMLKFKVIRCLSNKSNKKAEKFLYNQLKNGSKGIVFEAARSLVISGNNIPESIFNKLDSDIQDFVMKLKKIIGVVNERV